MLESINCPNCGAPLPADLKPGLTVCLYCNSSIRVQAEDEQTSVVVESALDEKELAEVKRLLLAGQRSAAVEHYRTFSGTKEEDAAEIVDGIASQITAYTARGQQLTGLGWLLVAAWSVLLVGGVTAGLAGQIHPILALVMIGFAGINLNYFIPSIRTTLQFARAPIAPAVTLKLAPIGVMAMRKENIHTFRAWLEVQPKDEPPFRAEMIIPVREANLSRAMPGTEIYVKYLKDPIRLIFHKRKSSPPEPSNEGTPNEHSA